jgi:hypothetical protein
MILLVGIPTEPPLALAIASAERLGIPHTVINQRHAARGDIAVGWRGGRPEARLWYGGDAIALETYTGLYLRTMEVAALPEHRARGRTPPDPALLARARIVTELLHRWSAIAPGVVANRPAASGSNSSKPFQAQLIAAAGLRTPPTLVTNDPDAVRAFHAEHGRVIYKSISGERSIVREWRPGTGPDLAMVRRLPTQFQAFIPGENVRVHVVGGCVFAHRVLSEAIDYRYAEMDQLDTRLEAMELPDAVAGACVCLARSLSLALAGIDLKRTPDGAWYCFEANPSPAYSYYQEATGQPIADALVRLLATEEAG